MKQLLLSLCHLVCPLKRGAEGKQHRAVLREGGPLRFPDPGRQFSCSDGCQSQERDKTGNLGLIIIIDVNTDQGFLGVLQPNPQ